MTGDRTPFLAALLAFTLLSAAAGAGLLQEADWRLLRLLQARPSPTLDRLGTVLSMPGRATLSTAGLAALALWLRLRGRGRLGLWLLVALAATTVVEIAAKFLVPQVPFPADAGRVPDPSPVDFDTPYPYPSGHMLRAFLLLGAAFALWPNLAARLIAALTLTGAAWSRIYLGTHWPSDVLGGALLGLAGLLWAFGREGSGRSEGYENK